MTKLDPPKQTNHGFPSFLPDGRHFLYYSVGNPENQGIYLGSLDAPESQRLLSSDTNAIYAPPGYLLFTRQGTLTAQRFDLRNLQIAGDPFPVAEGVAFETRLFVGSISSSSGGTIVYRRGQAGDTHQLVWYDRSGKQIGLVGTPDRTGLLNPEISPDGKRVAVDRGAGGNQDIWLMEMTRGVSTRFTFDSATESLPVWSPDGARLVFRSTTDIYEKPSSGAGAPKRLLESSVFATPQDWSPDGRYLLYRRQEAKTGRDLWILPLFGDRKPFPFVLTNFEERDGQFSPDGRWIAYSSNESGRSEIYIQPFPGPGGKWQVSTEGGSQPRWRRDGKELFYAGLDNKLIAAPIKLSPTGDAVDVGTPAVLFQTYQGGQNFVGNKHQYAVSPEGQRFLVNVTTEDASASPITLILNWHPKP